MTWERLPLDLPDSIPGSPILEVFRDHEGVKVYFQARYHQAYVDQFVAGFLDILRKTASNPELRLDDLKTELEKRHSSFQNGGPV